MRYESWTYRLEWIDCGKPGCKRLHGPYWYAYQHVDGRMRKRYVGNDAAMGREKGWKAEQARTRWNAERAADVGQGLELDYATIGVHPHATFDVLKKAYRVAIRKAHPDAGGNHQRAVRVNLAWERIQRARSTGKPGTGTRGVQ